jgi:hypothetical protein
MARQTIHPLELPSGFARHETFHPRFGWLKKGFDVAARDASIFSADDAHVQLGVGKNMAKAIRYWGTAFKLLDRTSNVPTAFGEKLLDDKEGFDPYLEDPASLWLLHWNLLKHTPDRPCLAAAWFFTFFRFRRTEFSLEDLTDGLQNWGNSSPSSLKKDATCLLRMYVPQPKSTHLNEDNLDCPFADLGLVQRTGDAQSFAFRMGAKPTLPPEIVVLACLEYADAVGEGAQTIAITRLLYAEGSPGQAFKLTESTLCEAIERVARHQSAIALTDSAGLLQLSFTKSPQLLVPLLLDIYYGGARC